MKNDNIQKDWSELLREKAGSYTPDTPQMSFDAIKEKMLAAGAAQKAAQAATRRRWYTSAGIAASVAAIVAAGLLIKPDKTKIDNPVAEAVSKTEAQPAAQDAADNTYDAAQAASIEEDAISNNNVTSTVKQQIHVINKGQNNALAQSDNSPETSQAEPGLTRNEADEIRNQEIVSDAQDSEQAVREKTNQETPTNNQKNTESTGTTGEADYTTNQVQPTNDPFAEPVHPVRNVRQQLRKFSLGASGILASNSTRANGKDAAPTMSISYDEKGNPYYSFAAPEIQYHYSAPVSAGLSLRYNITDRFYAETGFRMTLLHSWVVPSGAQQDLLYAGVPLGLGYNFAEWESVGFYGSAYAMPAKCVWGREGNGYPSNFNNVKEIPMMWSAGIAPGIEYRPINLLGVYLEPTLSYYFKNDKAPQTLYKENPFYFTVNVGVRFNLE